MYEMENYYLFEALETRFSFREGSVHLVVIYRPPPSQRNQLTTGMFFEELSELLERYACVPGDLILTGDFNFHFEDTDDTNTTRLRGILETFNMIQHVQDPTHVCGWIFAYLGRRHLCKVLLSKT